MTLRRLNYAVLALWVGADLLVRSTLPARIPLHYDFQGRVTTWAPTSTALWLLLPVLATAVVLFGYAVSRIPDAWQLPRDDLERFRALSPEARAWIAERVHCTTALAMILTTVSLMGLQFGIYFTAVRGGERMPWLPDVLMLAPLALAILLAVRDRSRVRALIRAADGDPDRSSGPLSTEWRASA